MHKVLETIIQRSPQLKWLETNTILLVRHGSFAYGTNVEGSDIDYKGVAIPTKQYFLGSQNRFEQAELKDKNNDEVPDAVIFEIRKFFNLAIQNNPNVLEVLFVDPSDHIFVSKLGEKLLAHKEKFLSKRIRHTLSGYAHSQLKRIKLHRAHFLNPPKAPPTRKEMGLPEHTLIPQEQLLAVQSEIQKEIDRFQFDFLEELSEPKKIEIRNVMSEMLARLDITTDDQWLGAARTIGLDENFIRLMQLERQYTGKKREYDQYINWKKNRNQERAALEEKWGVDLKHATHLVRLMRECKEVLTTGKLQVKRPDREELLAIRSGAWSYEEIVEYAERMDKECQELYETTSLLPKSLDIKFLDNLCIELVEESLAADNSLWRKIKQYFNQR